MNYIFDRVEDFLKYALKPYNKELYSLPMKEFLVNTSEEELIDLNWSEIGATVEEALEAKSRFELEDINRSESESNRHRDLINLQKNQDQDEKYFVNPEDNFEDGPKEEPVPELKENSKLSNLHTDYWE